MQWTATVRNIQASGSRPQNATIKISLLTRLSESGSGGQSSVTVLCVGREKTKQNKGSRICINNQFDFFSMMIFPPRHVSDIDNVWSYICTMPRKGRWHLLLSFQRAERTFWHFLTLRIYWDTIVNRHLNGLPVASTWYWNTCPLGWFR